MQNARPVRVHPQGWAWGLLVARPLAFVAAQGVVVAGLAITGAREPLWASAAWWPVAATLANLIGLALLGWRLRVERVGWRTLLLPHPGSWWRDAALAVALLPLVALAGAWPPTALGTALWGDPAIGQGLLVGPLPAWAALVALLLFPVTTAAVELPTYAGYVLPRLRAAGVPVLWAAAIVGLVLGVQHGALPFLPASKFFLWRSTMFLPFALVLVAAVAWRPRLLPWFVGVHLLLDGLAGYQIWSAAG
jgi:hypothetical protein